jgi:RNA polymerase sigma-70 factor (sigma-E family)
MGAAPHLRCMETTPVMKREPVLQTDRDAEFAAFFSATWPRLFRTTYAVAGDRVLAEDALQTAFAKVYTSWQRVQAAQHPEAYVRRMAINEVLTVLRRPWYRAERSTATPEERASPAPESSAVDRDAIWQAVCALPPRQRAVVVLRYYEDLSEAEIAEVLGCSRGTVKSTASSALANLRVRDLDASITGDAS